MRPAGPLPETCRKSTPASLARRRTAGDASGLSPSGRGAPNGVPRACTFALGRRARVAVGDRGFGDRFRHVFGLRRRRRRGRNERRRTSFALHFQPDQRRAHRHGIPDLGAEPENLAADRRGNFHRRLVGHHSRENRVLPHEVADLDVPFHQFGLRDAFADIGKLDHVFAHAHASKVSRRARASLAGPGK